MSCKVREQGDAQGRLACAVALVLSGILVLLGLGKLTVLAGLAEFESGALWSDAALWRIALTTAAVLEIAVGCLLLRKSCRRFALKWATRMFGVYLLTLLLGESIHDGFAESCGCFGPSVHVGYHLHLAITACLIVFSWSCLRLLPAAPIETRVEIDRPGRSG